MTPIPVNIIKQIATEISPHLSTLYNKIIETGVYPSGWKVAKVTPIFKKGSKKSIKNYRPISVLPVFSKVFETFIYDSLFNEVRFFIPESQQRFLRKKSTITNLVEYTHLISQNFHSKVQTDSVYIDFVKAFDRVPHLKLIQKLCTMGVNSNLLFLLQNYLRDRTQVVEVDGERSGAVSVTSGVIQGSILGPLLFSAYIWDLPQSLDHANCSLYADDAKIFMKVHNITDCLLLQRDLTSLIEWCRVWDMEVNLEKCQSITFTNKPKPVQFYYHLGNYELERVSEISDLGVTLSSDLSFDAHIERVCKKASKMLVLSGGHVASFHLTSFGTSL